VLNNNSKTHLAKRVLKKTGLLLYLGIFFLLANFTKVYAAADLTQLGTATTSSSTTFFGLPIRTGDVNCDGYTDLIHGDGLNDTAGTNFGAVFVYFGGASPDTTADIIITGIQATQAFSYPDGALAIGDINDDDCDDIAIGDYPYDSATADVGRIYVFLGSTSRSGTVSATTANHIMEGNDEDSGTQILLGTAVDIADLNNDGIADLVAGQFGPSTFDGKVRIYLGNSSFDETTDYTLTVSGSAERLGWEGVEASYDIDNDGNKDILAKGSTNFGSGGGRVRLFKGPFTANRTSADASFVPSTSTDWLGRGPNGFAFADFNIDGVGDLCIGAYGNDTAATNAGRAYCFYGPITDTGDVNVSTADLTLSGSSSNVNYGRAIYNYDANNDGYEDLIVGEYQTDGADDGKIYVYLGTSSGLNTTAWITISKSSANLNGLYGNAVYAADWDNDGWANIFVAEPGSSSTKRIYFYEIAHGTPSLSINSVSSPTNTSAITGTANDTTNFGGVQWSTSNSLPGSWTTCSTSDGTFNSTHEIISCDISSLSNGTNSVYLRSYDENSVYMPVSSFASTGSFTLDENEPADFSLYIPESSSYTNSSRPNFKWKAAATPDSQTSLKDYQLVVNYGPDPTDPSRYGNFSVSSISHSQTTDVDLEKYSIDYENFSDSDNSNNFITLIPKSSSSWPDNSNDGQVKEGKRSYSVTAFDAAGNGRSHTQNFFVDLTAPNITGLSLNDKSYGGKSLITNDRTAQVALKVVDPLSGESTSGALNQDEYKVASGPEKASLILQEKNASGIYKTIAVKEIKIESAYFEKDNSKVIDNSVNASGKYASISYAFDNYLYDGDYKLLVTVSDKAGNSSSQSVEFDVVNLSSLLTTEEKEIAEKTIEEEFGSVTPEEKEEILERIQITRELFPDDQKIAETISPITNAASAVYWTVVESAKTGFAVVAEGINYVAMAGQQVISFAANLGGAGVNFVTDKYWYLADKAPTVVGNGLIAVGKGTQSVGQKVSEIVNAGSSTVKTAVYPVVWKTQVSLGVISDIWFDREQTRISEVYVESVSRDTITIVWKTNHHTINNKINYGEDLSYGQFGFAKDYGKVHRVTIANLKPATKYVFEVMSQGKNYVYDAHHEVKTSE
jgi:hypothetical protein